MGGGGRGGGGCGARWGAGRVGGGAVVVMGVGGLLSGGVLGIIKPRGVLGDVFSRLVSLSGAIIYFAGSLSVDIR